MPTGYTSEIMEKGDVTFQNFALKCAPRLRCSNYDAG